MAIEELTNKEQKLVLACLKATAVYVDDTEKHSRLGIDGEVLQQIIERWPAVDDRDENGDDFLAINNCLNEVCNGFQIAAADWSAWFDIGMDQIQATYRKWLTARKTFGGIR
jgi:hypothetical protein